MKRDKETFDLDALLGERRVVRFGGRNLEVKELTLGDVLQVQEISRGLESAGEEELFSGMSRIIRVYLPEVPEEELRAVPLKALGKLHAFLAERKEGPEGPPDRAQ